MDIHKYYYFIIHPINLYFLCVSTWEEEKAVKQLKPTAEGKLYYFKILDDACLTFFKKKFLL